MKNYVFASIILLSQLASAQDLDSDLLLNLPISGSITDIANNSNIILSGTETFTENRFGIPGCAIKFTGINNEYINIPQNQNNNWQFGEPITISLWFKVLNVDVSDFEVLFSSGSAFQDGLGLCLYDVNTPLAVASDWSQWDNDWNATEPLYTDTLNWHHLAFSIDENYHTVLYRDNQHIYSGTDLAGFSLPQSSMDYIIAQQYEGALDDIRVYKRVLTPQEIELLYLSDSSCDVISGIEGQDGENSGLLVYPIPASDKLTFEFPETEILMLEIYNSSGQLLFSESKTSNRTIIDISAFEKGLYLARCISTKNQINITKFIKE